MIVPHFFACSSYRPQRLETPLWEPVTYVARSHNRGVNSHQFMQNDGSPSHFDGGRSSVINASEFQPEVPGFDYLAGQSENFFMSLRINSCADLFVPNALSCVQHAPKFVRTLKIPYSSVVEMLASAGGINTKTLHTGERRKKNLCNAVLWLLSFRGESSPNFSCIAWGQENDRI